MNAPVNRANFAGRPAQPAYAPTDLRTFWRTAPRRSRIALACAATGAAAWVASFAGVMRYPMIAGTMILVLHLAVMGLFGWHGARLWRHHRLAWRTNPLMAPGPRQPPILRWGVALSLVLLLVQFAVGFRHGEGNVEVRDGREVWVRDGEVVRTLAPGARDAFEGEMLRIFATSWVFISLVIALHGRTVEHRIREMGDR